MLCPDHMHVAWCGLRCQTSVSPGFLVDFWCAHMDRVVCCMLDVAALRMVRVACCHERARCCAVRDLRGCTLYVVSWRALLRCTSRAVRLTPRAPCRLLPVRPLLVAWSLLARRRPSHVRRSRCRVHRTASGADHTGGRCGRARALRPMAIPEGAA